MTVRTFFALVGVLALIMGVVCFSLGLALSEELLGGLGTVAFGLLAGYCFGLARWTVWYCQRKGHAPDITGTCIRCGDRA